jgi:hypothetical protein
MSTTQRSTPPSPPTDAREVRIYAHSVLFYWWPVWVVSFVLALLTLINNHRMAIVPAKTTVERKANEPGVYVLNTNSASPDADEQLEKAADPKDPGFHLRTSKNSKLGPIFVIVFLMVVLITSVPMRGLWSVIVIVTVVLTAIILALAEMWDKIFESIGHLHIHANLAFYLFMGGGLLVMWLVTVFFFDRQTYMIFTPGQLRVCLEIGGGETAYDTQGMSIEKKRDDMFRHWILGLGSGDLTVRTSGAQAHTFEMHNILNVSSKLKAIEEMQRERPTVQGKN